MCGDNDNNKQEYDCEICFTKQYILLRCETCRKEVCSECALRLNSLTCPYCRGTISDTINKMIEDSVNHTRKEPLNISLYDIDATLRVLEKIDEPDEDGVTPLYESIVNGEQEKALKLLKLGANPNIVLNGVNLLIIASSGYFPMVVLELISRGADIDWAANDGWTALHFAVANERYDSVEVLLEQGAAIDARTQNGLTPLLIAVKKQFVDIAELLIDYGADTNAVDNDNKSALNLASSMNIDIVHMLIEAGADINHLDYEERSSMVISIIFGKKDITKYLLSKGAEFDIKTDVQWTPLIAAIMCDDLPMVQLLIKQGVSCNYSFDNYHHNTPLHIAVLKKNTEMVDLLIKKGKVRIETRAMMPLITPLHYAAILNDSIMAEHLIVKHKANIHSKCLDYYNVIHVAVEFHHPDILKSLIEQGADINAKNASKRTPLHMACLTGDACIVELLLEYGADIYIKDNEGETAMTMSGVNGRFDILRLLADKHLLSIVQ